IRFKCANLISIFLRSCRDRSKPSVPANDRATSRACSWISRGILRDDSFGQHCGLSGHAIGVELPHHVIFGNCIAKTKLVEQLTLVTLQTAHHGSTSPRIASTRRNHASRPVSTDFCNKICQPETLRVPFRAAL